MQEEEKSYLKPLNLSQITNNVIEEKKKSPKEAEKERENQKSERLPSQASSINLDPKNSLFLNTRNCFRYEQYFKKSYHKRRLEEPTNEQKDQLLKIYSHLRDLKTNNYKKYAKLVNYL